MSEIFAGNKISGVSNSEITVEFALKLGKVLGEHIIKDDSASKKVIICRDTRLSGYMLESALCAGLCSQGINAFLVGVVPTCAMPDLVTKYKADMGVSVTAADLPAEYNGFRIFLNDGSEANEKTVGKLKDMLLGNITKTFDPSFNVGKVRRLHTALRDYVDSVKRHSTLGLSGLKVAIDCANGSGFECAKIIFSESGAHVEVMHNSPDGENINKECGIYNIKTIRNFVVSHGCDMGIALNGDGSEALLIDELGNVLELDVARKAFSVSDDADAAQSCLAVAGILADSGSKLSEVER